MRFDFVVYNCTFCDFTNSTIVIFVVYNCTFCDFTIVLFVLYNCNSICDYSVLFFSVNKYAISASFPARIVRN